jgi:hypothetical protein
MLETLSARWPLTVCFPTPERSAMPAPKEIELKLELPPASLPRLKRIPLLRGQKRRIKSATEVSVYFDTDKHKLHKKGMMLRVRRSGDRYVQTIKSWVQTPLTPQQHESRTDPRSLPYCFHSETQWKASIQIFGDVSSRCLARQGR